MTFRDLAEIEVGLSAASPAPWAVSADDSGRHSISVGAAGSTRLYIEREERQTALEDLEFIAHARQDIPRLIKALRDNAPIDEHELDIMQRRADEASGAPWTPFLESDGGLGGCSMIWVGDDPDHPDMYVWLGTKIAPDSDIEFIANARQDLPALISRIRRVLMLPRPAELRGWRLSPYEGHEEQPHWAFFRQWVKCGERSDYAWVDISPPLQPRETGVSGEISRVVLAPRHQGVYLDKPIKSWPVHVYLLTVPADFDDVNELPVDAAKIKAWGLLLEERHAEGRAG